MYGVGDHYSLHYDGYYELRGNRDYDTDGYRAGVWVGNRWVLLHSVQGHHYCCRQSISFTISFFTIMEKAPTRAFSWLKVATTTFTFNTLLRHYAKRTLIPRYVDIKLGHQRS